MNWQETEQIIREKCEQNHKSDKYTDKYVAYAKQLFDKGLPIIVSPHHLSMLIGLDHGYVCTMANVKGKFYRNFKILKSNGKERTISEPLPDLKHVQHWILSNILEKCPVSKYAKAFIKKKTLKSNARFHRAQAVVVSLDIKDFFPSISFYDVFNIFKEMGYSEAVSRFLANLCSYRKSLPQGAPTSPYLSNLRMVRFDSEVEEYIQNKQIRYTRYADDLTFSGDFDVSKLINDISTMLYRHGFKMNGKKTRVAHQNTRQEVTGIVVNSHMQIQRQKRKAIRQQVYYIQRFGLDSHLSYIHETRSHYLNHLLGQINYALFINPKDEEMKQYFLFIKDLYKERKEDIENQ